MPSTSDSLSCFFCRTPLRFRELPRGLVRFPCPECHRNLEIDGNSETPQVRAAASAVVAGEQRPSRRPAVTGDHARNRIAAAWKHWRQRLLHYAAEPLTVTWLVAGLAAAGLIIAVARERGADTVPQPIVVETESTNSPDLDRHLQASEQGFTTEDNVVAVDGVVAPRPEIDSPTAVQERVTTETAPAVAPREDEDSEEEFVFPSVPVIAARPVATQEPDLTVVIRKRLSQKLARFDQATPVPFDTMRAQVAELVAVPIWYDEALGDQPAAADVPVQASLGEVTVGEVLDGFAKQANLTYHVEPAGIRLVERESKRSDVAAEPAGEL